MNVRVLSALLLRYIRMIHDDGREFFLLVCWFELNWEEDACGALTCLELISFLVLFMRAATKLNRSSFIASFPSRVTFRDMSSVSNFPTLMLNDSACW